MYEDEDKLEQENVRDCLVSWRTSSSSRRRRRRRLRLIKRYSPGWSPSSSWETSKTTRLPMLRAMDSSEMPLKVASLQKSSRNSTPKLQRSPKKIPTTSPKLTVHPSLPRTSLSCKVIPHQRTRMVKVGLTHKTPANPGQAPGARPLKSRTQVDVSLIAVNPEIPGGVEDLPGARIAASSRIVG